MVTRWRVTAERFATSPLLLLMLLLFADNLTVSAQDLPFQKINSGTRGDIHFVYTCPDQGVFFFTDRIYRLENSTWKRIDVPADGKIGCFYPLSSNEFWYSIDQLNYTSQLYHFNKGLNENIRSPFVNYFSFIYGISEKKVFFTSLGDMAIYENGNFSLLPSLPVNNSIAKLFGNQTNTFCGLTAKGDVYVFERGSFNHLFVSKKIDNFCFTDNVNGYLISEDQFYQINKSGIKLIITNQDLRLVNSMQVLADGSVLMVGNSGLLLRYINGKLVRQNLNCSENLFGIATTGSGEIWICGENGRLLYHGKKQFPLYIENNQGFSSYKLINYGINTDDEYGVAIADFNNDNKNDIYAVRIFEQNKLYINNQNSQNTTSRKVPFYEEAVKRDADGGLKTDNHAVINEMKLGISVADVDNDGDQDIYLCYLNSTNKLLLNNGNGIFRNVSGQKFRACENLKRSNASAFADVDNDGDLDLFITSEEGSNRLFKNDGTGHFTDITESSGLRTDGGGMCASFADINGDGLPDLCVTFWNLPNKLYRNETHNGVICFDDSTPFTEISQAPAVKSNGVAFADVNNDGYPDLFIANRNAGNKLYINNGKGNFADKTHEYFEPEKFISNGAVFADFDLDGYLDLYITNVGDNILYKNIEGKYFRELTSVFGAGLNGYGTGCAAGDIDDDGDPDLYVANYINGNSKLFLNITEKKNFLKFKLHGVRSNKDAIGAKVWLYPTINGKKAENLAGYREINGGSGYASISAKEMIFGLEQESEYVALIKFPSSKDTIRMEHIVGGKTIDISETDEISAITRGTVSSFIRFFKDRENQPEIIKYLVIIILFIIFNPIRRKIIQNTTMLRWFFAILIFLTFSIFNNFYLYQWPSATFFAAPAIAIGLFAIFYLYIERILLVRLGQKEKLELREKLSRDLHDDLASTLGSVSIYAETLKQMDHASSADYSKLSSKIAALTQTALQSISDIIWMTSPRNDSLQSLISKTNGYIYEILSDNKIGFHSDIEMIDDTIILPEKIRNNVFLILKEALHNSIRHSKAKNVVFSAKIKDSRCTIFFQDDGVGIQSPEQKNKQTQGNGLLNMRRRSLESGIDFALLSPEDGGIIITLQFKI